MARAGLGHVSRSSPTDHYLTVTEEEPCAALTSYERDLEAAGTDPPDRGERGRVPAAATA